MNRPLKDDINTLFDGEPEESQAARKKLGLEKAEPVFDAARLEGNIWNTYKNRNFAATGPLAAMRSFMLRPWAMPAFALATLLAAVGLSFYDRQAQQNIQLAQFDYVQNSVSAFTFHEKIKLHLRQAQGLALRAQGQNIEIGAARIWGLFEFEKKPGNSLTIKTPHGIFSVTGTRFILFTDEKEARLQVEEGTVQVEKNGRKMPVTTNEQYHSRGEFKSTALGLQAQKLFDAFRNPSLKNDAAELLPQSSAATKQPPTPSQSVAIQVTLFDGNSIQGTLISETADALVIQPKNFKAITVRKTEIKESTRR